MQADTLAIAKQPSNADKLNSTTNGTSDDAKVKNKEHSLVHNGISLQEVSPMPGSPQAVWRVDHKVLPNNDISNAQTATSQISENADADNSEDAFDGKNYHMIETSDLHANHASVMIIIIIVVP